MVPPTRGNPTSDPSSSIEKHVGTSRPMSMQSSQLLIASYLCVRGLTALTTLVHPRASSPPSRRHTEQSGDSQRTYRYISHTRTRGMREELSIRPPVAAANAAWKTQCTIPWHMHVRDHCYSILDRRKGPTTGTKNSSGRRCYGIRRPNDGVDRAKVSGKPGWAA